MQKQAKRIIKNVIKTISLGMVKISNGSASANFSYQPKEPRDLKQMLENKNYNENVDKK